MVEFELFNYNVPNRNFIQLDDIDITDGLKRKDNGKRDFVGTAACYCNHLKQPFVLRKQQNGSVMPEAFNSDIYEPDFKAKLVATKPLTQQ